MTHALCTQQHPDFDSDNSDMTLDMLSHDVLQHICAHMHMTDQIALASTCSGIRRATLPSVFEDSTLALPLHSFQLPHPLTSNCQELVLRHASTSIPGSTDTVPSSVQYSRALDFLTFSTMVLPRFTHVTRLDLAGLELDAPVLGCLQLSCPQLRALSLNTPRSDMTDVTLHISGLSDLQRLTLEGCSFSTQNPNSSTRSSSSSSTHAVARQVPIGSTPSQAVSTTPARTGAEVAASGALANNPTSGSMDALALLASKLPGLRELALVNVEAADGSALVLSSLQPLQHLTKLTVEACPCTLVGLPGLGQLQVLCLLHFNPRIPSLPEDLAALRQATQLTELTLMRSQVTPWPASLITSALQFPFAEAGAHHFIGTSSTTNSITHTSTSTSTSTNTGSRTYTSSNTTTITTKTANSVSMPCTGHTVRVSAPLTGQQLVTLQLTATLNEGALSILANCCPLLRRLEASAIALESAPFSSTRQDQKQQEHQQQHHHQQYQQQPQQQQQQLTLPSLTSLKLQLQSTNPGIALKHLVPNLQDLDMALLASADQALVGLPPTLTDLSLLFISVTPHGTFPPAAFPALPRLQNLQLNFAVSVPGQEGKLQEAAASWLCRSSFPAASQLRALTLTSSLPAPNVSVHWLSDDLLCGCSSPLYPVVGALRNLEIVAPENGFITEKGLAGLAEAGKKLEGLRLVGPLPGLAAGAVLQDVMYKLAVQQYMREMVVERCTAEQREAVVSARAAAAAVRPHVVVRSEPLAQQKA